MVGMQSGTQMTDFGHARAGAVKNPPVDDQSAADARADRDVEHHALVATGAKPRFGQGGHIAIVLQSGWHTQSRAAPFAKLEVFPTVDLMALDHPAAGRIDRPAKANSDRRD